MEPGKSPASETRLTYRLGFVSDVGNVRTNNEDSFLVYLNPEPTDSLTVAGLFAVADGMGGQSGGEVASNFVTAFLKKNLAGIKFEAEKGILDELHSVVEKANFELYRLACREKELAGMGTTLTCVLAVGNTAYIAHIGDSRGYLVRNGRLTQLTEDHSWVADEVRAGRLSAEQARIHPDKNIITRSVGSESRVEVDMQKVELDPGDVLLLASDGLINCVEDRELEKRLTALAGPQSAAQELVDLAKTRGGDDNITVIIVQANEPLSETAVSTVEVAAGNEPTVAGAQTENRPAAKASRRAPAALTVVLAVVIALVLIGLSFFAGYSFHDRRAKLTTSKPAQTLPPNKGGYSP